MEKQTLSPSKSCKCGFDVDFFYKRLGEFEEGRKRAFNNAIDELATKIEEKDKRQNVLLNKLVAKEEQRDKELSLLREELGAVKNEHKSLVKDSLAKAQQLELQLQEENHKFQMLNFQYQHERQSGGISKNDPQVLEFMRSITQNLVMLDDKVVKTTHDITKNMVSKEEATAKQMENLVTEVTTSKEARWKRIEGLTTKVFNLEEKFEAFQNTLKKGNEDMQTVHNDISSQIQTLIEIFSDGKAVPNRPKRQVKKP